MYFRSVRPVLGVALGIATLGLAYVFLIADYAHIARGIAAVTLSHGLHTVARGGVSATTCEAVQGGSLGGGAFRKSDHRKAGLGVAEDELVGLISRETIC